MQETMKRYTSEEIEEEERRNPYKKPTKEEMIEMLRIENEINPILPETEITQEEIKEYSQLIYFLPGWVKTFEDCIKFSNHMNFRFHEARFKLLGNNENAKKLAKFYKSGERL